MKMKRIFLVIMLVVTFTTSYSQSLFSFIKKGTSNSVSSSLTLEMAHNAVLSEDFNKAIEIYNVLIDNQKKDRSQGSQVNNELLAEYAYVLSLAGAQEMSLINIDIAQNLDIPKPVIYYYIGSILEINGFGELSAPYNSVAKQPNWLQGKGNDFNKKYRSPIILPLDNPTDAINHITGCIKESRLIEALCYSTYLTKIMPKMQSGWLLQSAVLEKLGFYEYALNSYEKGMELSQEILPGMDTQLSFLKDQSSKKGNSVKTWQLQSMIYGGLSYSNDNFSINGRYGIYAGKFSYSANLSLSIPSHGDTSFYTGLSCYYNINKFFTGMGVGWSTSASSSTLTLSPTVGMSFINSKRTSSFDISLGLNVPCQSGMSTSLMLSIGKTFYFNSKGNSK